MVGYGPSHVWTQPPALGVADAMRRSGFYPGSPPVTVRETHTAWVFLAGERAYKVKKPVRMEFLDFSTLERRRRMCLEEIRLNAELAPRLDMRLRAIVALSDSYVLVDPAISGAVEYAIEMRRFDESRTMAALAERGELAAAQVRAVGRRLAAFHASAAVRKPPHPVENVRRSSSRNLRELLELADDAMAHRVLAVERFSAAFLVAHRAQIAARAEAGAIRDGHGDLRAEHVVLEQPMEIVDRLEFDPHLREIDVADDLAFLTMDLERLGAADAACLLVTSYRNAGGDPGGHALRAFFGMHRALVRAKVALLRAKQIGEGVRADAARERAGELVALAERLAWRARGPLVIAISGPPASGKSTLAAALSRRSDWPVLSSDALRKDRRGLKLSEPAPAADYTIEARADVYRELGARAAAATGSVVVDATFGDPRLRAAFLEGLGDAATLCALECRASAEVRDRWARERDPSAARGSDAAPEIAEQLAASYTGWSELPDGAILALRAGVDPEQLVDQVADWLDTRSSVVFPTSARLGTEAAAAPRA